MSDTVAALLGLLAWALIVVRSNDTGNGSCRCAVSPGAKRAVSTQRSLRSANTSAVGSPRCSSIRR